MAEIVLILAGPVARQLAAQDVHLINQSCLLSHCQMSLAHEVLTRVFDCYVPVVGVNTAATTVKIAGRICVAGRGFVCHPAPGAGECGRPDQTRAELG
jgi:hypothetical protein